MGPFCLCGAEDTDEMILCDDNDCQHRWFHYICVGITEDTVPRGDWFCLNCTGTVQAVHQLVAHLHRMLFSTFLVHCLLICQKYHLC